MRQLLPLVYLHYVVGIWALTQSAEIPTCYYDCGLHIDDDDTMYVVHGNTDVNMAQLSADGLSEVKTEVLFHYPAEAQGIEGNRMYKRNDIYYILNDDGGIQATYIWKSTSPWGPWTYKLLQANTPGPLSGGGTPHQGSLIEASPDDWYFMSFTWDYPNGRIPVLAPITWGDDDFPILTTVDGKWGATYPAPLPTVETPSWTKNRFIQRHHACSTVGMEPQPRHHQILRRQRCHPLRHNGD